MMNTSITLRNRSRFGIFGQFKDMNTAIQSTYKVISAAIRRFHFPINQTALEIFRVTIGLLILVDLLIRFTDLEAHYTNLGVLPKNYSFIDSLIRFGKIDIFFFSESFFYHQLVFVVGFVSAFAFCIGFKTKLSQIMLWIVLLSVQNRIPYINEGADIYIRVIFFWSLFLPLGKKFTFRNLMSKPENSTSPIYSTVDSIALYVYSVQIGLVYLCSVLVKAKTSYWPSGRALELAFQVDVVRGQFAELLLPHTGILHFLTYLTLGVQFVGFLALVCPPNFMKRLRVIIFGTLIGMHLGIALTLAVGLFPYFAIFSLIPLFPQFGSMKKSYVNKKRGNKFKDGIRIALITASLLYVSLRFIDYYNLVRFTFPTPLNKVYRYYGKLTGLNQQWIMFSGIEYNPYGLVIGRSSQSQTEIIFEVKKLKRQAWDKENDSIRYEFSDLFSGYRWKKLFVKAFWTNNYKLYNGIGTYICRKTSDLSKSDYFTTVEFIFFHEKFKSDFEQKELVECHRAQFSCSSRHLNMTHRCDYLQPRRF